MPLFKSKPKPPTAEQSISRLRETEEMLEKKSNHIEAQINQQLKLVKQYGTKNKQQALRHLKKKKMLEKQLEQVDNTLTTIEFQRQSLQNAHANAQVLSTMKGASQAMKTIHKSNNIDKVDDVMADIQEQQDIAAEISDAISRPVDIFPNGQYVDDDELLAELDDLENEEVDLKMANLNLVTPAVPTKIPQSSVPKMTTARQPVQVDQKKDDELADLEAWLA